jgi:hypothetical protein
MGKSDVEERVWLDAAIQIERVTMLQFCKTAKSIGLEGRAGRGTKSTFIGTFPMTTRDAGSAKLGKIRMTVL